MISIVSPSRSIHHIHPKVMSSRVHSVSIFPFSPEIILRGKAQGCLWRRQRNVLSQPPAHRTSGHPSGRSTRTLRRRLHHTVAAEVEVGSEPAGLGTVETHETTTRYFQYWKSNISTSGDGSVKHINLQTSSHCGHSGGGRISC